MRGPQYQLALRLRISPPMRLDGRGRGRGGCAGAQDAAGSGGLVRHAERSPVSPNGLGARQAGNSSCSPFQNTPTLREGRATVPCSRSSLVILRVRRKQISTKNRTAGLSGRGREGQLSCQAGRVLRPQLCFVPIFVCFSVDRAGGRSRNIHFIRAPRRPQIEQRTVRLILSAIIGGI